MTRDPKATLAAVVVATSVAVIVFGRILAEADHLVVWFRVVLAAALVAAFVSLFFAAADNQPPH